MILYVSYRFETDIGAQVNLNILKEIYGEKNVFIADLRMLEAKTEENYVAFGKYHGKSERILQWLQGNTMYISDKTIRKIGLIITDKKVQLVFIEDSIFGNLAKYIKSKFPDVLVVAFYHDIAADLYRQKSEHSHSLLTKIECSVAIRQERMQQRYNDVNIVFSQRDVALYQKYYQTAPDAVIPLSGEIPDHSDYYVSENNVNGAVKHILFVGTRYWPNIVGIRWFYQNVMPKLPDNMVLDVVGRGTEFLCEEFTDPRVVVHGTVDDVYQYYREADIVIAPLFDGGGMKTKTVEAISYGKCIVGTDEGLVGFWDEMDDSIRNKCVFLCNTAQEWIDAISKLAEKDICRFNFPLYDLFLRRFSYDAARKELSRVLKQV